MTFDQLMDNINVLDQERRWKLMQSHCEYIATKAIREKLAGEADELEAEIRTEILNFVKGER